MKKRTVIPSRRRRLPMSPVVCNRLVPSPTHHIGGGCLGTYISPNDVWRENKAYEFIFTHNGMKEIGSRAWGYHCNILTSIL